MACSPVPKVGGAELLLTLPLFQRPWPRPRKIPGYVYAAQARVNIEQEQGRLSLSTDGDKCAMVNFFGGE